MRIVLASEFSETIEKKIVLASDHAGFTLKTAIAEHLRAMPGREILDIGTYNTNPVDYPPICAAAARLVISGEADFAVVMGGSGQGEQISANKVRGIRAALCHDEYTARFARLHNDANVLALGARLIAPELACAILDVFLETDFEGGRHAERLALLAEIEAQEAAK
jgi:ribose 5-phosphate isomerase B